MTLSDAIRLGAMLGPQVFGRGHDINGGTCALFSALDAAGLHWIQHQRVAETFPLLVKTGVQTCPSCLEAFPGFASVANLIVHLNDAHRWTRERIADQIAAIELEMESVNVCQK